MPKFRVEQIAITPKDTVRAKRLLAGLGLTEWFRDTVTAEGNVQVKKSHRVFTGLGVLELGNPGTLESTELVKGVNEANLQFNYQAGNGSDGAAGKPLELEILQYTEGPNWVQDLGPVVSHLGMHCTAEELLEFRDFFASEGVQVAQEVETLAHTNPNIAGKRTYNYVIFDTRSILGVDLKFIVRRDVDATKYVAAELL